MPVTDKPSPDRRGRRAAQSSKPGVDPADGPFETLGFERLKPEEKYRRIVPGLLKRIRDLYAEIHARFGDEGLQLIRDVSSRYGRRAGENARARGGVSGVEGVGRYLLRVFDMVTADWEVSHFDETKLVIKVSKCPYPFTDPRLCEAHTTMEKALVEALDPSLEYRIGRSTAAGDEYCEHILTKGSAQA